MKHEDYYSKMQQSAEFREMFKEIIKLQIQTLIDQLSHAGEECVLLTACTADHMTSDAVGSEIGRHFLSIKTDLQKSFSEFCLTVAKYKLPAQVSNEVTCTGNQSTPVCTRSRATPVGTSSRATPVHTSSQPTPVHTSNRSTPAKRKFSELDGEDSLEPSSNNSLTAVQPEVFQMSGSLTGTPVTPTCKVKVEQLSPTSRESTSANSAVVVPKGYSKCSLCDYMSKFKANVTRHERSRHGINMEGAPVVSVVYACSMCQYKSEYRSNLQRHEKSVHKIHSTPHELESRKIPIDHLTALSFNFGEPARFDFEAGNQNQSIRNLTGSQEDVGGNQTNMEEETEEQKEGSDDLLDEDGCHICNYCQLVFKSLSSLKDHIDSAHFQDNDFKCETCDRTFNNLVSFQAHVMSHNNPKKEVCACGKEFQYKISLNRHQSKCSYLKTSLETENGSTSLGAVEDNNSVDDPKIISVFSESDVYDKVKQEI